MHISPRPLQLPEPLKAGADPRCSSSPSSIYSALKPLSKKARTASELYQEQVEFARDWTSWEPALVAQYHRDWFGC